VWVFECGSECECESECVGVSRSECECEVECPRHPLEGLTHTLAQTIHASDESSPILSCS